MADNLVQNVELPEREELYTQFTQVNRSEQQAASKGTGSESEFLEAPPPNDDTSVEPDLDVGFKHTTLIADFYNLVLLRRLWYYLLSLFTRKPAEMIFQQDQFQELRKQISQKNNRLISYDRGHKIYLISPYLPEQFNPIFKLSLEILPVINQVDRNRKFMKDIIIKLIFHLYKNRSGQMIRIDAKHFIDEKELRDSISLGDAATREKINSLMEEVSETCKNLPHSLYKYSIQVLRPLYQFQKICYFPFSNFFQTFRNQNRNNENIYSSIPPKEAYESIDVLYHLIKSVGKLEIDTEILHRILESYFYIAHKNDSAKKSQKKIDEFIESFIKLQNSWNDFIQKIPAQHLLMFVAKDPYLDLPPVHYIDSEILKKLSTKIEKIYYQIVVNNIETMVRNLQENLTQYYLDRYLPNFYTDQANFYYKSRKDLMPTQYSKEEESTQYGPFHYCESFAYMLHFLSNFFTFNISKPLYSLRISLFQPDSNIYKSINNFISDIEKSKVKLDTINKNLNLDNLLDKKIKEIILRIEHRSEGAKDEYRTVIDNIDRQIRFSIEYIITKFKDFLSRDIPAMENLIQDDISNERFITVIPEFQYMYDYNNPEYAPLTPSTILELWKCYISDFILLLDNQLERERQDNFGAEME